MRKILFLLALLFVSKEVIASETMPIHAEGWKIDRSASDGESMWDDYVFGAPGKYATYYDDFFEYTAADWTLTTTENGTGSATEALTDSVGGVLLITLDNSLNDADGFQLGAESVLPAANKTIFFEARFKVSDATDSDVLFGLVVTDTSPESHANGIVFEKDDTDTQLDFKTTASSVTSTEANINTIAADTYVTVGFKVTGTSLVEYWVNDVKQGSFTTNIPTTELRPTMYYLNGTEGDVGENMSVDYMFVAQER